MCHIKADFRPELQPAVLLLSKSTAVDLTFAFGVVRLLASQQVRLRCGD